MTVLGITLYIASHCFISGYMCDGRKRNLIGGITWAIIPIAILKARGHI
jgi:hypothetical protein